VVLGSTEFRAKLTKVLCFFSSEKKFFPSFPDFKPYPSKPSY